MTDPTANGNHEGDPEVDPDPHTGAAQGDDRGAEADLPLGPDEGSPDAVAGGTEPTPTLTDERLVELRTAIDGVTELPVGDRVAVFERVNADLASELAALDEL